MVDAADRSWLRTSAVVATLLEATSSSPFPEGGDVYLMKYILHDWDETPHPCHSRELSPCDEGGAKLLVVEDLVAAPTFPALRRSRMSTCWRELEAGTERNGNTATC